MFVAADLRAVWLLINSHFSQVAVLSPPPFCVRKGDFIIQTYFPHYQLQVLIEVLDAKPRRYLTIVFRKDFLHIVTSRQHSFSWYVLQCIRFVGWLFQKSSYSASIRSISARHAESHRGSRRYFYHQYRRARISSFHLHRPYLVKLSGSWSLIRLNGI